MSLVLSLSSCATRSRRTVACEGLFRPVKVQVNFMLAIPGVRSWRLMMLSITAGLCSHSLYSVHNRGWTGTCKPPQCLGVLGSSAALARLSSSGFTPGPPWTMDGHGRPGLRAAGRSRRRLDARHTDFGAKLASLQWQIVAYYDEMAHIRSRMTCMLDIYMIHLHFTSSWPDTRTPRVLAGLLAHAPGRQASFPRSSMRLCGATALFPTSDTDK
ncbi:hypothetical protein F4861DRAFT_179739 [Xylaria intraflava]|nr:hypothetical protein F4861DRAFT_179739 [Xylaria intraflava]